MGELQKISSLVTGGQASAGPPLGPALGPMGVNIMEVINAINEKTKDFEGMKVPVIVSVDTDTKKWDIEIGIPSAAALLLKETGIQKGSGTSGTDWVGDIKMDGIIKVAKTKLENSYADSLKSVAKDRKEITNPEFWQLYKMIGGNTIRNSAHQRSLIEEIIAKRKS